MSHDKQHSPQHEELLKKQALEQSEVKEVLVFIQKYAKSGLTVVLVICALFLANRLFKNQRLNNEIKADTALMQAGSVNDLQAIVDDYASTPAGPLALMGLAKETFNAGSIDEAEAFYTTFTKKYGDHELALQAELNLIACMEAKGQLDDAHMLYREFADEHQGTYLVPEALMGQARCLEALGLSNDAQIAYEDIIVNFPETSWAQVAEMNLKVLISNK